MSENINITLQAQDDASSVLADASDEIDSSLNQIGETAEETGDQVQTAQSSLVTSTDETSSSLKSNALAANNLGTASMSLAMSFENVENAEVSLDRAHVLVEKDTNAVQAAQEKYNEAVAKYGPTSQQAIDAANKLSAAQDALTVAHEREDEAQRNVNNSMLMAGLTVIPSVITAVTSLSAIMPIWSALTDASTVAQWALGSALTFLAANPVVLVIAGIAGLAIGLYEAYEHCAPFRDAINEIGSVLAGFFSTALTDIKNALMWLWQNVLVPIGQFLIADFQMQWQVAVDIFNVFRAAVDDVYNALSWLWNNVLVPIGNFLSGVFAGAINDVMAVLRPLIDAVNTVSNIGKAVGGVVGGALKSVGLASGGIVTEPTLALIGEAGPEAVVPLGNSNSSVFGESGVSPLEMTSVSPGFTSSSDGGGSTEVKMQIQSQPVIQNLYLSSNPSTQEIINALTEALNRGQGNTLVSAFMRAFALNQGRR